MSSDIFKEHKVTIQDFESDHWVILGIPDEVCQELATWIEDVVLPNDLNEAVATSDSDDFY